MIDSVVGFIVALINHFFLGYFLFYNTINLLLNIGAFREIIGLVFNKRLDNDRLVLASSLVPPLSIIIPAYNEEVTIVPSLVSLFELEFPEMEIVIVNDGSHDNTMEVLREYFDLTPKRIYFRDHLETAEVRQTYVARVRLPDKIARLIVIDKENGGKADALNAGINASLYPYVVTMDADSYFDPRALIQVVQSILKDPDIVAIGGQVGVANGCEFDGKRITNFGIPKTHIGRFQLVEYLRSFTSSRTILSRLESVLILSGVFTIFRKRELLEIGGFLTRRNRSLLVREYIGGQKDTVCEDMEVVVRLHRYFNDKKRKGKVVFLPYPVCWTEVPEHWESLGKQRNRWYRGFLQVLTFHRSMILNPRYGVIAMFGFPYFILFEALGPIFQVLGFFIMPLLYLSGLLSLGWFLSFMAASILYGAINSLLAVLMGAWKTRGGAGEEKASSLLNLGSYREFWILLFYALVENMGYSQLRSWWCFKGLLDFLRGKEGWQKFARIGMAKAGTQRDS